MATAIRWHRDGDGIVVLTLDDPGRAANTMNEAYVRAMEETVTRLERERDDITGVVLTSAKKSWFAGGDLDSLRAFDSPQAAFDRASLVKAQLRRLELLGRPVVAAINGAALGGGLEIALACHRRIALTGAVVGCPEVTLGLLPAGGGVVRSVRLLGLTAALTHVLLKGTRHEARAARELGLIDEVVETPEELLAAARRWIRENPDASQPWDTVRTVRVDRAALPALPAMLRHQLKGAPYPAPRHILAAAVESTQVDVDTAFVIESRYFAGLVTGPVAKNMIKAFFFDRNAAAARDIGDVPPIRKAAVLGAGMMGAGIAQVLARAGVPVVLRDVDAGRAAAYASDLITPTADVAELAGADLVIEAVFEDPGLKHKVFAEIEDLVAPDALLCSNTSTLPITSLAEGVRRQGDFIGLHFFSPVPKMPLVEVIRGEKTGDEALRRALAVVRLLRKTPIVVNDSRGFFTSRVIGTFTNEGVAMLAEGVPAASIEQASSQAGYPAPVLALVDELTLTLPRKIRQEALAAGAGTPHPADAVIDRMIDEFGRPGRSPGAGFYEYEDGRRTRLWPGLKTLAPPAEVPFEDLKERLLFIEAIEAVKCLDEGVLTSVAEANIGSILGIGYPGWTGGVLQYINQYEGGLPGFAERARQLAGRYGERFAPPALLLAKAADGTTFD
ncbi:3-hydroxyacyl-CoA dehydrogenase [Paractinoplanes deccanensis]|uniref:3-hydroxyacyl-CoA dehydrogenase n=1 Tax=Paractinoplanes deccanensis TaxID=113561 RepID=A0ABQ3YBU0_9ACTN|nr:3-hydroxyacyl-CoA dehydrogenase NAD-binding domain-containing protein [Actinoplanes deccanensis]GID77479.1 3-hydroxyacyl-CoA dehydrogenase [Actinoplanes deccanensis]